MSVVMSILAVLMMVIVDQAVKYWAVTMLAPVGSIPLVPGILQLTYVENRGAAFSILEDQIWLFVILALVIVCGIAYALQTNRIQTPLGKIALLIVAAGAVGNVIDRITHHYVVDMIEVTFIHFQCLILRIFMSVSVLHCSQCIICSFTRMQKKRRKNEAADCGNRCGKTVG